MRGSACQKCIAPSPQARVNQAFRMKAPPFQRIGDSRMPITMTMTSVIASTFWGMTKSAMMVRLAGVSSLAASPRLP